MFISEYIHNVEEGVRFCERYGISAFVADGVLTVADPSLDYLEKFEEMVDAARKLEGFCVDHPNCFLSDAGCFIVTFSNYDAELTEKEQKKIRRKGYDLRESGFDLYGYGTKTYVMAELVSPLDVNRGRPWE